MKVGVIGDVWSVTHSVSWAVWAYTCHPLTSCMAYAPPTRALPPGSSPGQALGGGRGCWKARVPTEHPEEPLRRDGFIWEVRRKLDE